MIRKLDLIALLERIPGNPEVTTWDSTHVEEHAIEVVLEVTHDNGLRVVVLGMEVEQSAFEVDMMTDAQVATVWSGK